MDLGIRVGDAINLLEATSLSPAKRRLWRAPSPTVSMLAAMASASCSTTTIALKKLPKPQPAERSDEAQAEENLGVQKQKGG